MLCGIFYQMNMRITMKKYVLIILAISVMTANTALASDVIFYGKANISLQAVKVEDSTKAPDAVIQDNWELFSNSSRLGVKGITEINESLQAIYQLEYETSFDDGDKNGQTFTQRNIFLGIQGDWGAVMGGMHDSPVKIIGEMVDIFSNYQLGDIKYSVEGENRIKNMVMYRSPNLKGIHIDILFAPGEQSGGDTSTKDDQDGLTDQMSASVLYNTNFGLSFALGVDSEVNNHNLTRFIVAYGTEAWGVSGMIQSAKEVDYIGTEKEDSMVVSVYSQLANWQPKLLVSSAVIKEDNMDDIDVIQIALGVDYKLGKKTKVFAYTAKVEEEVDNITSDSVKEITFGIGLEHKF